MEANGALNATDRLSAELESFAILAEVLSAQSADAQDLRRTAGVGGNESRAETVNTGGVGAHDLAGPFGVQLDDFSDPSLVAWAQQLELVSRIVSALQVYTAGLLGGRAEAARFSEAGISKPIALLVSVLNVSAAESKRRLKLADSFLPHVDALTGVVRPALHPVLGQAFLAAKFSPEQALIAADFADEAMHLADAGRITHEIFEQVEQTLADYAVTENPEFLRRIGQRLVSVLDPDGQCPTQGQLSATQGISFRKPRRGMVHFDGNMTVLQFETLMAGISWATNPKANGGPSTRPDPTAATQVPTATRSLDPDSASCNSFSGGDTVPWPHIVGDVCVPEPGSAEIPEGLELIDPNSSDPAVRDERTHRQKLLDGMIDCVKLAARSGQLSLNGGLKTQLFLTTTASEVKLRTPKNRQAGILSVPFSGPQAAANFEQALCDVDVTNIVFGEGQEILSVGRTKRLFTPSQRRILLARDLGCCFPDCMAPVHWCEAHHVIPWQLGGPTDINNAALLCSHHHSLMHSSEWSLQMVRGRPTFTPPHRLDPAQRPRQNNFHQARVNERHTAGV